MSILFDDLSRLKDLEKSVPMKIDKRILRLTSDELVKLFGFNTAWDVYMNREPAEISSILDQEEIKVGRFCEYKPENNKVTRILVTYISDRVAHGISADGKVKIVLLEDLHALPFKITNFEGVLEQISSYCNTDKALAPQTRVEQHKKGTSK